MANQIKAPITVKDGYPYNTAQETSFAADDILIQQNSDFAPNVSLIQSKGSRYYTTTTVDDLVSAANSGGTAQVKATVMQKNDSPFNQPLSFGFPTDKISIDLLTGVAGANSKITYNGDTYIVVETVDTLVTSSDVDPDSIVPANPSGTVGLTAKNGVANTYMRSDAAPALDPTILTQTGEGNKIPQLDSGGNLVIQNDTTQCQYGPASIFFASTGQWLDIDASGMEIDLFGGSTTIHMGLDGIDAADQPITTSHVPAADIDLINKAYFDAQIAAIPDGLTYKGSWNASTNTPTLANGSGTNGDFYKVSAAGSRDLGGGVIDFEVGDHVVYVAGTDNAWENFGQSAPVPANPSTTVGLTAKNGVALSFMRSDAAPALDQTIAPTWTGLHKFSQGVQVAAHVSAAQTDDIASPTNSGLLMSVSPNVADLLFYDATQTANNRTAEWIFFEGKLQARFKNDAGGTAIVPIAIEGGQATGITGITSNSGSGAWLHTGTFGFTGPLHANGQPGTPGQILASTGNATPPAWVDNLPVRVATAGETAQAANINSPTLYAVPTSGMYRVSAYLVVSQAATTSSTLPSCEVSYTEAITSTVVQDIVTETANTNQVGLHVGGSVIINALQGSNIGYITSGYASSGATPMQYAVEVRIEFLG